MFFVCTFSVLLLSCSGPGFKIMQLDEFLDLKRIVHFFGCFMSLEIVMINYILLSTETHAGIAFLISFIIRFPNHLYDNTFLLKNQSLMVVQFGFYFIS